MIRNGLVIYLLIATAVGPGLCCCETGRALNSVAGAVTAYFGEAAESATAPTCCSQRQPTESPETVTSKGEPEKLPSENRPCPCKRNTSADIVLIANDGKAAIECQRLLDSAGSMALAVPMAFHMPNDRPRMEDQRHLPFLTSTDLLDVHHLLRC